MKTFKKLTVAVLMASMLSLGTAGCFGKFVLTGKVYKFNKEVHGNVFVQSLVMWLLSIPYGITLFLDACIFNLIEAFTGNNPMALLEDGTAVVENGDSKAIITREAKNIRVDFYEAGIMIGTSIISRDENGILRASTDLGGLDAYETTYDGATMKVEGFENGNYVESSYSIDQVETILQEAGLPLPATL